MSDARQTHAARSRKWGRRVITVPAVFGLATWLSLTLPIWLPALLLVDGFRRKRLASTRTGLFFVALLGYEALGVLKAGSVWLRFRNHSEAFQKANFELQCWWVNAHVANARRIFGVAIDIDAPPDLGHGPVIAMMRHTSIADATLGGLLFSIPHGIRLRYVLKRELQWGPCLDIVGNRLRNVFVARDGENSANEVASVADLARGMGTHDGVIIYPEGTRFTPEKRERILASLRERKNAALLARAQALKTTLPPRPGGALALLDAAPEVDVVLVAHVGFEGIRSFFDLWNGRLIDARIRVHARRISAHKIPPDRTTWLFDEWERMDDWISRAEDSGTESAPVTRAR